MDKKTKRILRIIKIIVLVIIIGLMAKCVHTCRYYSIYHGEDNSRYFELKKRAKKLPQQPMPLTEIFPGNDDAYFFYLPPYHFVEYVPCPQFSREFIDNLGIKATTSENISRWVIFDASGVIENIAFFDGMYSYGYAPCARLSDVYWTPGTHKLEIIKTPVLWMQDLWAFPEITNPQKTPNYDFTPSNAYSPDEFAIFFAQFSDAPEFQLTNTSWPLQVFHIDPEEPGLHVEKTVYYNKPDPGDKVSRTLFPIKTEREAEELTYTISMHKANTGPQAAVVLNKAGYEHMLYVYAFQWHNGWYLLEISDLTYRVDSPLE